MAYNGHMDRRTCSIDGCNGKHKGLGYCEKHLTRFRTHGDPLVTNIRKRKPCSIEGCDTLSFSRGWCQKHYRRWKNHGDPNFVTVRKRPGCIVEGCGGLHNAHGYCLLHYQRVRSTGSTDIINPKSLDVSDVFDSHLGAPNSSGCIEWQGTRNQQGYGKVQRNRKAIHAHRYAYERAHGPIPEGLVVRHKCDNPPCVNPDHLEVGTALDNARDAVNRGRTARGEKSGSAILTEGDVLYIRKVKGEITQVEIARMYGVSRETVSAIHTGRTWSHLLP